MAEGTKVSSWEFVIAKADVIPFVGLNDIHLASFVDLILTLELDPFNEPAFLYILKSGLITCIVRAKVQVQAICWDRGFTNSETVG